MSKIEDTIEARGATHGDPERNAVVYTELRDIFATGRRLDLLQEWALDMIAHKLARIVTGNPNEPDHWHDIAGYATIVASTPASSLPGRFRYHAAKAVLQGDIEALRHAFAWEATPQGHGFWQRQWHNGFLDSAAYYEIQRWVRSMEQGK